MGSPGRGRVAVALNNTASDSGYDSETGGFKYPRPLASRLPESPMTPDTDTISMRLKSRVFQPAPLLSCLHFMLMGIFVETFVFMVLLSSSERNAAGSGGWVPVLAVVPCPPPAAR